MPSFEEPGMQAITLSLISLTAVLGLASVTLGLVPILTGKDPLPKRIRRVTRRTPASADDFRLRGTSLMLNGAAVMLIASDLAINIVAGLALIPPGVGFYTSDSLAFPKDTMFLVTLVAGVSAIALFVGAYGLGIRVRYVATRPSADGHPQMPPA